jgi:hypothetical protein
MQLFSNAQNLEQGSNINNNIPQNFNATNIPTQENSNHKIYENVALKERYLAALKNKDHKRPFQVFYIFKNKIKRMYRIDCMTRKINV